ncbi:MAG: lysine--tRNA ligase [Bradymonadia bacterium]
MSDDQNRLVKARQEKVEALRERGDNPFANDFAVTHLAGDLHTAHADHTLEDLEATAYPVAIAGRVMAVRKFGKMNFIVVQDRSDKIQIAAYRPDLGEDAQAHLKLLDVGDIVGTQGQMMRSKKGELTVKAAELRILTKSTRPLPEKWAGLSDVTTRYRQRYVDLIVNERTREIFRVRSEINRRIRQFFDDRDYMEVETPMLQSIYGGAAAKPFETHHNALDMDLFMRIAPELNLKRLVVGGFHRVYELNKNFRNEGVSTRHNPEFTALEFYEAFATYEDLMQLTEELFHSLCVGIHGTDEVTYGEHTVSFARPFRRLSVMDGLVQYAEIPEDKLYDRDTLLAAAERLGVRKADKMPLGKLQMEVFETAAEHLLIQPTYVIDYPLEVSPLSRRKESDPRLVDRFELYVAGQEIANGFSELNDPVDQRGRFEDQVGQRAAGDDEAHPMDEDFIRALEFGLPPTAGEGIGIDRLVMLLTNSTSIREVIFFPLLRPEA